jgi:hypothetical protein
LKLVFPGFEKTILWALLRINTVLLEQLHIIVIDGLITLKFFSFTRILSLISDGHWR